ncbi:MAG: hypothetical protein IKR03_01615 [Clostridia bacterium]|nr:hypothetical protein [Christensenellaceae bacterium]MBR6239456.1 hypothetical protein [Clostridia bacterium]
MSESAYENCPCLKVLWKFTGNDVPKKGPEEVFSGDPRWALSEEDTSLPGGGMSRYPFIYVGEGYNKIILVNDGKVIWTYDTGTGGELDDIWMLSNGNVLFSRMYWCAEVSPDKKRTWYYEFPEGEESHSLQPVGLDKVLMVINAAVPRAVILNKYTGETVYSHEIPYDHALPVHTQFRRIRLTKDNTFLVSYLQMGKVVEYDMDFNLIREIKSSRPWSAQKLLNGNILITDENELAVKEIDINGDIVWSVRAEELPDRYVKAEIFERPGAAPDAAPGTKSEPIGWQSCVRLANGNTVLCSQGNFGLAPQFIEITKEKEIVWALKNWKDLGPATSIQILSDPGIPENPGECQR